MAKQAPPYSKPIDYSMLNNEDDAAKNLLRQINHHAKTKKNMSRSLQENLNGAHTSKVNREIDEEISSNNLATLTIAVLKMLNQLEIKFPGKSDQHTKSMLTKVSYLIIFEYKLLDHY